MTEKNDNESSTRTPRLWERQHGELSKAYAAFCLFRDLPTQTRSLRAVTEVLFPGRIVTQVRVVERWSVRYSWIERVTAWEDELDKERRAVLKETVRTMAERHVDAAQRLQKKGLDALEKVSEGDMSASDIRLLIIEGAKLERLSRGEPTEKYEQGIPISPAERLTSFTEDELRSLAEVASRAEEGASETETD